MANLNLQLTNDGDNNSNDDVTIDISAGDESLSETAGELGNSMKLEQMLFGVGLSTLMIVVNRIAYKLPPGTIFESHQVAYYIILFGIFLAGVAEVYVGANLLKSGAQYGGRGRAYVVPLLCTSVVLLAATIALGGAPVLVMV